MKKILGSLLLIIVLWLGTTAVIGNKTKNELEKSIERGNRLYLQHGLQFKIREYQKSFFESTATIEIATMDKELERAISQTYGLTFPIVSEYHIEHGPLFFSNGLGIGVSKIHQEMEINSIFNKEMKEKFLNSSKLTSNITISFSKVANYKVVTSDAINIKDGAKMLHIEPLKIIGEMHIERLVGEMKMTLPHFSFQENDKKIDISSMELNATIDEMLENALEIGTVDLSIEQFLLADKENGEIDIQPTLHMKSQKDGEKTISSLLEVEIGFNRVTVQPELSKIEKIVGKIQVNGLGFKGVKAYQESMQGIEQKQATLMIELQKNPKKREENYAKLVQLQKEIRTKLFSSLKDMLFQDKTSINYGFDVQTKDKKESHGDILLGYTGDIDFNQTAKQIRQKIGADVFKLFKLEVDIRVDKNHIKSLPNGEELIKQLQTPMAQNMIIDKNNSYTIKGHLANQELILNDNNLTNTILPLLKMFAQMGVAQ